MNFPIKTGSIKKIEEYANKTEEKELLITEDSQQLFLSNGKGDLLELTNKGEYCNVTKIGSKEWKTDILVNDKLEYEFSPCFIYYNKGECSLKRIGNYKTKLTNNLQIDNLEIINNKENNTTLFLWELPKHCLFKNTIVVKNSKHYPKDIKDGEIVYIGGGNHFEDDNLGETFYYSFFVENIMEFISDNPVSIQA